MHRDADPQILPWNLHVSMLSEVQTQNDLGTYLNIYIFATFIVDFNTRLLSIVGVPNFVVH